MTTKRMKSDEVRKNWADVLQHVRTGGTVVIEHYNRPVAQIRPLETDMASSTESASTPIADGGYVYDPERDREDFDGFTTDDLRELEAERGFDFSAHPALAAEETTP